MLVELLDEDSGMESLVGNKDEILEPKPDDTLATASPVDTVCLPGCPGKEYDDEPDECLSERLWGLTEMFPEPLRSVAQSLTTNFKCLAKNAYGLSRSVVWIVASSSVILFAPVIFEVERAQMEEMQKCQQKQVLLGTNAALTGPMPPMPR